MRIVQLIILIFTFSACLNEPDCLVKNTNELKVSFKINSKTAREITFDEITVSGLDKKYYVGSKVSSVRLPVNPSLSETIFTFKFEGRVETLKVFYDNVSKIISPSCGAYLYQENLLVNETTFGADSVIVVFNQLLTDATVNIEIYIQ